MDRPIFCVSLITSLLVLVLAAPLPARADPLSLAEQEAAAERRGDAAAALALYSDDAIIQYGGLCWTPCVGKDAIQKELERRMEQKDYPTIIGKYVTGNVVAILSAVRLVDRTAMRQKLQWSPGVDRLLIWTIYETKGDKIAVATLAGQRTDPQTASFIKWSLSFKPK